MVAELPIARGVLAAARAVAPETVEAAGRVFVPIAEEIAGKALNLVELAGGKNVAAALRGVSTELPASSPTVTLSNFRAQPWWDGQREIGLSKTNFVLERSAPVAGLEDFGLVRTLSQGTRQESYWTGGKLIADPGSTTQFKVAGNQSGLWGHGFADSFKLSPNTPPLVIARQELTPEALAFGSAPSSQTTLLFGNRLGQVTLEATPSKGLAPIESRLQTRTAQVSRIVDDGGDAFTLHNPRGLFSAEQSMVTRTGEPVKLTELTVRKKDGALIGFGDDAVYNTASPVHQALQLDAQAYRPSWTVENILSKRMTSGLY